MVKSIIKEIGIIILLIIAILLVLGIIFYDYRPSTKKIPSTVAEYTLPQDMQEELEETIEATEKQNIIQTYRVDSKDLIRYERNDEYIKGKPNPFGKIESNNNSSNSSGNNTGSTGNNTNNSSSGKFFNTVK